MSTNDSEEVSHPAKLFTVEEANRSLPLVRAIAEDMARLSREIIERRERLAYLRNRSPEGRDLYSEESRQVEDALEEDSEQLHEYVQELRGLGVEPKNGPEGLVDFPALRDGRVVYLCWRLGEPAVQFWHELDAGFVGRQPLEGTASQAGESPFPSPNISS